MACRGRIPRKIQGPRVLLTCDSVAHLQTFRLHGARHPLDQRAKLSKAAGCDLAELTRRRQGDGIVIPPQKILGIIQPGTRKPYGNLLDMTRSHDLRHVEVSVCGHNSDRNANLGRGGRVDDGQKLPEILPERVI